MRCTLKNIILNKFCNRWSKIIKKKTTLGEIVLSLSLVGLREKTNTQLAITDDKKNSYSIYDADIVLTAAVPQMCLWYEKHILTVIIIFNNAAIGLTIRHTSNLGVCAAFESSKIR